MAAGLTLPGTGLSVPECMVLCPLPAFLWGQSRQDISGCARLWGGLHHKGKCSAEHLPIVLTQHPDVAALGVLQSFLSLPYCPMLHEVGTGGSHCSLLPSVGLSSLHGALPPPQKDTSHRYRCWSEMQVGPWQQWFRCPLFVPGKDKLIHPLPGTGMLVPGILAQVSSCHHPQIAAGDTPNLTPTSPLSHGQGAATCPMALPTLGHPCPGTHPSTCWALSFLHLLQNTTSKALGGTESFLQGSRSRFAEQEPTEVAGAGTLQMQAPHPTRLWWIQAGPKLQHPGTILVQQVC